MKEKDQLSHFERYHKFISDIFDEAIEKTKQKNKTIHFNILASRIKLIAKKNYMIIWKLYYWPKTFSQIQE